MPVKKTAIFFVFLVTTFLFSCNTGYRARSVQYKDYRISNSNQPDSGLLVLLQPYTDSVNKSMNDIIAVSEIELVNKRPEGTLGNILADAALAMARINYKIKVDAGIINYGGIRLPVVVAGNITRGTVFEISPFDNVLVVLKIKGNILQQLLDHIAGSGGWPCAGLSYQIKNKKAVNITIDGLPFNEMSLYTIATNDYIANGGDDCSMLRGQEQINNGFLFRDAVIAYFTRFTRAGKKLWVKTENRVTHAE